MKKRNTLLLLIFFNFSLVAQNTTTLVVSGQGKTQLEAQHNALRSAIEQASGAFISSNTEILNDEVIKDEIISITNGNIQEFTIISEIKIPNGEYAVTLKATVSLQKLVSFINNNGGQAELNGGLFAANVKQQVLNEENEVKTIQNMCNVLDEIAKKMFKYDLKINEPRSLTRDNSKWEVKLEVNVGLNENSSSYADYMYQTLTGLRLSSEEISNYLKLNKEVFPVSISSNKSRRFRNINLRSTKSIQLIINQLLKIKESLLDFNIDNEIRPIKGSTYKSVIDYQHYSILLFNNYNRDFSAQLNHSTDIYRGTLFHSNDNIDLFKSIPTNDLSFFNTSNKFYITSDKLIMDRQNLTSSNFGYQTGHIYEKIDASIERNYKDIFRDQFRGLNKRTFLSTCLVSNKEKIESIGGPGGGAFNIKITKHHLGLVISFANFTDSYFVITKPAEFDQEGRQISSADISEFTDLVTLIFNHNLTIDQIEQIDKYEINK